MWLNSSIRCFGEQAYDDSSFGIIFVVWIEMYSLIVKNISISSYSV